MHQLADTIELTLAAESELGFLQALRNDPVTRALSRRQHIFSIDDTRRWVFAEERQFYIARMRGEPVGFLSFGRRVDGAREVSIVLAPEYRGKGLGQRVLSLATRVFPGDGLTAEVRATNAASLAVFRACGFVESGVSGESVLLERRAAAGAVR
jgi:RimJ/RimL family protein N-acetyltransferase